MAKNKHEEKLTRRERLGLRRSARKGRNYGIDRERFRMLRIVGTVLIAIPVLLLAAGIVRFVSMPLTQAWALGAYSNEQYADARGRLAPVEKVNIFEPYLPHLTKGTAYLRENKFPEARGELEKALSEWTTGRDLNKPPHAECKIRNNLAVAMTGEARGIKDPGERGDLLYSAEEVLAPCQNGGSASDSNEDKSSTGKSGEQIEKERKEADREAGKEEREGPNSKGKNEEENPENDPKKTNPEGDGKDGQTPTPDPEEQKKQEELKKQNGGEDPSNGDGDEDGKGENEGVTKPW
ncbi:hypothetical protein M3B90_02990 [Dermabacter sp. p3-SID358]|uniref:hypothetical protein n=1 Tax=Dermabacter sp. p3-SID358 TaxID=2916114 RepID=UPI0021A8E6B4|nr:hypothetical protein [Dermabacter sp. p3-SID358]MCT1866494.1 hypothetical protein [Dermabacter sp. p3-SID358]